MNDSTKHHARRPAVQRESAAEPGQKVGSQAAARPSRDSVAGLQAAIAGSPRMLAQRRAIASTFGVVQAKGAGGPKIGFAFAPGDEAERVTGRELVTQAWEAARTARKGLKTGWMTASLDASGLKGGAKAGDYAAHLEGIADEEALFRAELKGKPGILCADDAMSISYKTDTMVAALEIATLKVGADAFHPKAKKDGDKETARGLFVKEGREASTSSGGAPKEYVQDSSGSGTLTRRYAYVEKNFYQMMDFFKTGTITGRFQQALAAAGMEAPDASIATPKAQKIQTEPAPKLTTEQIAVAHQFMGSSSEQRGVSLTSTEKVGGTIGNEGKNFREAGGFRLKVDLALVPPDIRLINHYSHGGMLDTDLAAAKVQGVSNDVGHTGKNYKYGASVTKNRELFLERLRPEWVVEIEHHGDGGYASGNGSGSGPGTRTAIAGSDSFQTAGTAYSAYWTAFDATLAGTEVAPDAVSQKGKDSATLMMDGYAYAGTVNLTTARPVSGAAAHAELKDFDVGAKAAKKDDFNKKKRAFAQWQIGYVWGRVKTTRFANSGEYATAMSTFYAQAKKD
ncbi:hypothetical protein [Roseateles sp. L2-2]|uniref:hypothetical protein n=1 Tax=Roseateles sp. L2-2 TaxID=3422597 RepID=UPI003D35E88B